MAQAGNPGTPPAAGAPAAQGGNPEGGNPSGAAPVGTTGKRLIAGKYETLEDAVEQGILGMEQAFHKTREDLAKVTRVLEYAVGQNNPPPSHNNPPPMDNRGGWAPVGTPGRGYNDPYGRGAPPQDPDYIDPTQFIVNPNQFLQQREARMMNRIAGVVENVVQNAMVVTEFKRQHPDLIPHERVVNAFMQETDRTKPYHERLEDAARMTTEYLTRLKAPGGNPPPTGGNFVENPRGVTVPGTPVAPGQGGIPPEALAAEEAELMDYIKERNTDIAARFGIKTS